MEKDLGKRLVEIIEELDDEKIKLASDEELMGYLFLAEKMKKKLEKACKLEEGDK